jgi:hypothetical protein
VEAGESLASIADHHFFLEHEMAKRFWAGVIVFGALLAVGSLQAHHSLAGTYDLNKTERATGVIQKVAFTNPHGALTIEIKNKEGVAQAWVLTTGSINVLVNAGVSATGPNRLKAGDIIQVSFNPARNGSNLGFLRSMTLPDKTEAEFVPN